MSSLYFLMLSCILFITNSYLREGELHISSSSFSVLFSTFGQVINEHTQGCNGDTAVMSEGILEI